MIMLSWITKIKLELMTYEAMFATNNYNIDMKLLQHMSNICFSQILDVYSLVYRMYNHHANEKQHNE
jgi:hypothetical protein